MFVVYIKVAPKIEQDTAYLQWVNFWRMMQEPLLVLEHNKQKVSWTKFTSEPSICWQLF